MEPVALTVPRFALQQAEQRLEAIHKTLCGAGLHPGHYDTTEKAARAAVDMIEYFRHELANPPHDVQCLVLKNLGVEGYAEAPRCKIVSIYSPP